MINARAETAADKPAFRSAFRRRRCLIPADGFYEWKKGADGKTKTPTYIGLASGEPFAFAGLWEIWKDDAGEALRSCTLLTTGANELMKPIHDRMPVILPAEAWGPWLDPARADAGELAALLRPYPAARMKAYAVSRLVNSPRNDGPELLTPADEAAAQSATPLFEPGTSNSA